MNLKFRWFILGFLREPETVNKQFGLYKISLENDKLTIFQGYKKSYNINSIMDGKTQIWRFGLIYAAYLEYI